MCWWVIRDKHCLSIEWIPVSRDENFLSANMLGYHFQMLSFSGTRPPGNGAQLLCMTVNTITVSVLTTNAIQKLSETRAKTKTHFIANFTIARVWHFISSLSNKTYDTFLLEVGIIKRFLPHPPPTHTLWVRMPLSDTKYCDSGK